MAKINIPFDNTNYSVDEQSLSAASSALKSHMSTVMNGSGATINLGGTSYNVDSAKLTDATNAFVAHLATIAGEGKKVFVNGVEYSVGSDKVQNAVSELHIVLGGLHSDDEGSGDSGDVTPRVIEPGLYETGSNYTVLLKDWDTLISKNLVSTSGNGVYANRDKLAGDLAIGNIPDDSRMDFAGFKNITGVYISGDVKIIPSKSFINCTGLTRVIIGEGVTEIKDSAFASSQQNLTNVEIPDSIINIEASAFMNCSMSAFNEYDNALYLGNSSNPYVALMKMADSSVASVNIHPDCKVMAYGAIEQCDNLTNVTIPDGVVSICNCALLNSRNISSVIIPESVVKISYQAFNYLPNLTSITYTGTVEQWNAINKSTTWYDDIQATEIMCSDGTVSIA